MPARLTLHEEALVGLQLRPSLFHGSYDANRGYRPNPASTTDLSFQEDLVGAFRFLSRGQVSLALPFLQNVRTVPGVSEWGGGLGDLSLAARWDFINAGESASIPGIAVLAGITFPTGRAPESAQLPLLTDSTGTGAFQFSVGLGIEQNWGHWFALGNVLVSQPTARSVEGLQVLLGTQLLALAGVGYGFDNEAALALSVSYTGSREARVNGAYVPGSGRARLTLGIAGSIPINEEWRLQGSIYDALPINGLGRNEPAGLGINFVVVRSWT